MTFTKDEEQLVNQTVDEHILKWPTEAENKAFFHGFTMCMSLLEDNIKFDGIMTPKIAQNMIFVCDMAQEMAKRIVRQTGWEL